MLSVRVTLRIRKLSEEVWLPISGYRGEYEVSSLGRIKVLGREVNRLGRDGLTHRVLRIEKILTPKKRGEYLGVSLWLDGVRSQYNIHRLVCLEFNGEPPNNWEVNHINEDKYDNSAGNLEWVSRSKNQVHSKGPDLVATRGDTVVRTKGVKEMAKTIGIAKCSVQRMLRKECKSVKGWEVRHSSPHRL